MENRIPTQARSIAKRNKIVEKGFELMCEKGYFNTTTPDIAEYAEVSTGIVYQYFNDKKEIFLIGVQNYSTEILYPVLSLIEIKKLESKNLEVLISDLIDKFIKKHTISKKAHEEIIAMSHLDEDIANIIRESELLVTNKIVDLLNENSINIINAKEKVHIIIHIVEDLCHEIVYHKHKDINYTIMKEETIKTIINILK